MKNFSNLYSFSFLWRPHKKCTWPLTLTESSTDCASTSTAMPRLKKGCWVMSYILARKPPFSGRQTQSGSYYTGGSRRLLRGLILVTVFTRSSCGFPNFHDVWMVVGSIAYHPAGDTHGPLKCWVATLRWTTLMYRCLCVSGILPLYSFVSLSFEINVEFHPKWFEWPFSLKIVVKSDKMNIRAYLIFFFKNRL